ncbi:MAG: hypothetical protein ABSE95_16680 [Thermodesulfobacteriota bacterium]
MNRVRLISRTFTFGIVVAACCFVISSCVYHVPITSKATRKVDTRLLGNWTSKDGKTKMKVVKLDDSTYKVSSNGDYLVYHSDVAGTAFVSVKKLKSNKPEYYYWIWKLSDDGTLILRNVNDKVVPDNTKDSASVQELLKKNLQNPALFGNEIRMTKDK